MAPDPISLARAIRKQEETEFTAPSGHVYLLLRPKPMHLIAAGIPIACFSQTVPMEERLEQHGAALEEIHSSEERAQAFARKLMAACMLAPRFHNGDVFDCPDDSVAPGHIEPDIEPVFRRLMEMAGYFAAAEVAAQAEAFREHARGEEAERRGEVLSDTPEHVADGGPVGAGD